MQYHPGLSLLADVSRKLQPDRPHCYPVKKKGEKRQLNPNWEGIAWLEEAAVVDTEIVQTYPSRDDELDIQCAHGYTLATFRGHPRPMFDLLHSGVTDLWQGTESYSEPCDACYDFSRSWKCPQHGEQLMADRKEPEEAPVVAVPDIRVTPNGLRPTGLLGVLIREI